MKFLIHVERELFSNAIAIQLAQRNERGVLHIATPVIFRESTSTLGTMDRSDPCLRLQLADAQSLIDALWGCGLRPSEGTGSAGSLAATERHLRDMQSIAKGLLKKDGVEV